MGPPGAGKGTQAKKLVDTFGMLHLSSGDILRAEKASGSALGAQLAGYMNAGKLVPDETVVDVMAKALTGGGEKAGLLLDGFPRTVPQAKALDEQLTKAGKPLDAVVVMTADPKVIVTRITGRQSCPKCGKVYHVTNMPPRKAGVCDACAAALTQRDDDNETVVKQRLDAYNRQTEPVIAYYRSRGGLNMIEVDGGKEADAVFVKLAEALRALGAGR
ncbi:MAG: adenylate kinase [Phycisphaerae bacterium]|jgi:adenylate kinase